MFQSNIEPAAATLLPAAIQAVSEAGAMIRAEFHRRGGSRGGGSKAPIDTEVEQALKGRLLDLHACGFVGEETDRNVSTTLRQLVLEFRLVLAPFSWAG